MATLNAEQLAEIREDFAFNDVDEDGRINFDEFCELLLDLDAEFSPDECLLGFHGIDLNGSGSVTFDEFVEWWTKD